MKLTSRFHHALTITALAVISLAVAGPASAGGPLAVCDSSTGTPFLWPAGGTNIPFNPDQGDLGPLSHAAAVAQVEASFQAWQDVPSSTVSYVNAGELPVDVDITNFLPFFDPPAPDGLSAIVFDDTGEIFDLLFGPDSGILGFAGPEWGDTSTCEILEGVSFLNGPAFTDLTAATDVMVHEFGHYTNLAHTVVNGQIFLGDNTGPTPNDTFGPPPDPFANDIVETMYPFYFGPGIGTQTLEPDDIAIVSTLYPEPSFFASTASIQGTIFMSDGLTKVTGVNVIARNVAAPFEDAASAISSDFTDVFSQANPFTGLYTVNGLTPDADYAVYVDGILAGGFSTPPAAPLPGAEEFWNDTDEDNQNPPDDPAVFVTTGAAAGGVASDTDVIFNRPNPGDPLPVGDDGFVQLTLPFDYQFCGESYDSVFVHANGFLTLGEPDTDLFNWLEDVGVFLAAQPRIAGWWDDLSPFNLFTGEPQGEVFFDEAANWFSVTWADVPEFENTGSNTFTITLRRSSDHIDVDYGSMDSQDGIAGVSCGGAVTSGFEQPVDLSSFGGVINLHNQPARFEQFTSSSPNDLAGSGVRYNGTTNYHDNWAESNGSFSEARNINLPFSSATLQRYTEIEPTGADVDYFRFSASADTSIVIEVISGQLDSLIGLFDSTGTLVATDDDGGSGLLSRLVHPVTSGGDFVLAVTTFNDSDFDGDGGSGGRYVLEVSTVPGLALDLGDDDFVEVPLEFSFPFQGSSYDTVFVNSNGNLTFGSGDTDFSESVGELLSEQPRIAPLWDDLSPNAGGSVMVEEDGDSFTVTFAAVPEFFTGNSNTFAVTLNSDGSVQIDYGVIDASDGLVGVTEGGGATDPGGSDLSTAGTWPASGTTYEDFNATGPFDLEGSTLLFSP